MAVNDLLLPDFATALTADSPPQLLLQHSTTLCVARFVLCWRFIFEIYDKIARFSYWNSQIANSGFGSVATFLMVIIILLLSIGVPAVVLAPLLSRRFKWRRHLIIIGLIFLLLFQLPATILFESGAYEISGTVSILGGLLLSTCSSL